MSLTFVNSLLGQNSLQLLRLMVPPKAYQIPEPVVSLVRFDDRYSTNSALS